MRKVCSLCLGRFNKARGFLACGNKSCKAFGVETVFYRLK